MSASPKSLEAQLSMQEQWDNSMLGGANSPWLELQYEQYLHDPNSVDESWRDFFAKLPMVAENVREVAHSEIREQFRQLTRNSLARSGGSSTVDSAASAADLKQIYVTQLINAYRVRGHQLAQTDPLGQHTPAMVREVRLHENGLSESDLDTVFQTPSLEGIDHAPLRDIISHLEKCYCGAIGYEFMYIDYTPQKDWLQQRIESVASSPTLNTETREWILQRVTAAESMERHLGSRYVGQKRFSLEGGESLLVVMSELVRRAGAIGVKDMVIGMAHRGRLNVLVNILGKNPADLFQEFEGKRKESLSSGDVKYHQGFSSDYQDAAWSHAFVTGLQSVAPGNRIAGCRRLCAITPGPLSRQERRAGHPHCHPWRRSLCRSGCRDGNLQHGRFPRFFYQGHCAHHHQQPDRFHHQ